MSLVAHRFGCVEFRIIVVVFFRQAQLKKSKQVFEISKSISYQGHYIANQNLNQVFSLTNKSKFAKQCQSLTSQFLSRLFQFSSRFEFQVGHPNLLFESTYNFDNHWSKMHLNFFSYRLWKFWFSRG